MLREPFRHVPNKNAAVRVPLNGRRGEEDRQDREKKRKGKKTSFTSSSIITPNEEQVEEMAEETPHYDRGEKTITQRQQSTRSNFFLLCFFLMDKRSFQNIPEVKMYVHV